MKKMLSARNLLIVAGLCGAVLLWFYWGEIKAKFQGFSLLGEGGTNA